MVLERPDPVVAHHADDRQAVAGHRVELHAGEAEGAVAEQQADLALGMGELGADRLAGAGAEAAEGARVHPAARLVGLDEAAGVGDEVAAVADHDRVAVEDLAQLPVDAHRVQRRAVVVELAPARRRASPPRPCAAGSTQAAVRCDRRRRPTRGSPPRLAATSPTRSRSGGAFAVSAFGAASSRISFASSPKLPPKPSRKSSGTPITSATSAPLSPAPRARLKASSWSAGRQPRPRPLRKTGMPSASASARSSLLALPPVEAGAGHDRRPLGRGEQRRRLLDPVRRPRSATAGGSGTSASASMKTTSSG